MKYIIIFSLIVLSFTMCKNNLERKTEQNLLPGTNVLIQTNYGNNETVNAKKGAEVSILQDKLICSYKMGAQFQDSPQEDILLTKDEKKVLAGLLEKLNDWPESIPLEPEAAMGPVQSVHLYVAQSDKHYYIQLNQPAHRYPKGFLTWFNQLKSFFKGKNIVLIM